jgi:CYTH domain-containing protein
MDKTYRTEFRRKYLIEALPEPLTRASRHLQLFDNYITGTRMRIRTVRDPETKQWSWILQQRLAAEVSGITCLKIGEIHLDEAEHTVFEVFEGNEIRKNRYFHEFDGRAFAFDVYLGPLWGLNVASVEFADAESLERFEMPSFAVFDVTNNAFFLGENLVEKKFEDVQGEVARIGAFENDIAQVADNDLA